MIRFLAPAAALLFLCFGCVDQKDFDLDPRPHGDTIRGLESLLYAPNPPEVETTQKVLDAAEALASGLDQGRPPGPSKEAAAAVRGWASGLAVQGEVGYVALDLPKARKGWQAIRDANFRPEPFFKTATGDLDDLQRSRTGGVDAMQLTLITLAAGELDSVLKKGEMEAETISEITDEAAGSPEAIAIKSEWDAWVATWERKLGSIDWPPRPPLAAEEVGRLFQQLKEAEKALAGVTAEHPSGVTPKEARTQALATARKLLDDAKARTDALRE